MFFLAHNAVVTQSVFAPVPQLVFDQLEQNSGDPLNQQQQPGIIDFTEFFLKTFFYRNIVLISQIFLSS